MKPGNTLLGFVLVLRLSIAFAQDEEDVFEELRGKKFKKWRQNKPPKMIVFGASNSDVGRLYNAPASFQYEQYGIGPVPFKRLYAAPDSDEKIPAYLPFEGTYTNGKTWPKWLRVPDEHNFATASAGATSAFRPRQACTRYTGEGEDFPTGTLGEQITRYFNDIGDPPEETLDYTHVILIGNNDIFRAGEAITRYSLGGAGYQDPVPFNMVFQVANATGLPVLDESELPIPNFAPVVEEVVKAWDEGIDRLVKANVTGTILLANIGSAKGIDGFINTTSALVFDEVASAANLGAQGLASKYPQVKVLDIFTLFAALVDNPSIYEDLGFKAPEGSFLADPCIKFNFTVDSVAEIMGTQDSRNPDCKEECALCANDETPCQTCYEGNPAITVCDDPYTRVFWDNLHITTEMQFVFAEAVRQCSKDEPDYERPLVGVLCP